MNSTSQRTPPALLRAFTLIAMLAGFGEAALAAVTDIASEPLSTSTPTSIKPNLLFILDDSGSMALDYLPDEANMGSTRYGTRASQCNGLAYNPLVTYKTPVNSVGVSSANGSLSVFDVVTGNLSSITSITSVAPTVAAGSLTVTVSSGSYSNGNQVTIYSDTARGQWMYGTVTAWDGTSRQLTVNVTGTSGSGTMTSPRVGTGDGVRAYFAYSGSQTKLNFTYTGSGVITSTPFYLECNSSIGSTPGSAVFSRVTMSTNSADAQNYANWVAYYTTRMEMMKASVSHAFKDIGDRYRVGFTTIRDTTVTSTGFLNIASFDATQKLDFYNKLFAATPGSYTPLRGALSKAGQYYAKKASGQTYDPVQYSCQKNYTLLSTDGYWNTPSETSSYGPYKLNRTSTVGQQDGPEPTPFFDGAKTTVTTTEKYSVTSRTVKTVVTPKATVASSIATTTTATPVKGWARNQYSGQRYNSVSNSNISRCPALTVGACTITVTTSANHGFVTGNTVTVSGVNLSVPSFNGAFPITRLNNTQYTYTLASRPSTSGSGGTSFYSPVGCPSGQGRLITQPQRRDESSVSNEATTTTTTTPFTETVVTTTDVVTPYTVTTTTINGVPTVNTVAGTPTTTSTPVTTNTSGPDPATTSSSSSITAGANTFSAWTNFGSPTSGACSTSINLPNPNPSNQTAVAPSSTTPVATGPVTTNPPSTITAGTPLPATTVGPTVTQGASTTTSTTTSTGGVSDSLADVAMYYYKTDLRDSGLGNCVGSLGSGIDVCENKVSPKGADDAKWQHMTTFTLGLGVNGLLKYDPKYLTQTSGDYFNIKQGLQNWPLPGPTKEAENIDDLWHAAVNGRGQYFSAGDPVALAFSLESTLKSIDNKTGSASAAAASNLQPVQGDNKLFIAQYVTGQWTGDLIAKTIGTTTGTISETNLWSARAELDSRSVPRTIRYFKGTTGNTGVLQTFNYPNLQSDSLAYNFDAACSMPVPLSQCATLAAVAADTNNPVAARNDATSARAKIDGKNLVDFLAGVRTYEQSAASPSDQAFRTRVGLLGDIVGGAPVYVKKPPFKYTENGYAGFVALNASRAGVVYVGANDGMLHAFEGDTGRELWAHIPSFMLPKMYRLADADYANRHEYFVDGAPVIGDIFVGGAWKTVLVGGLGGGGRGYYALDITDPNDPKALWEFKNPNLGLSFGNPVITKRASGTWVVAFASGYNNNTDGGDGNGHLFVLDANTGALVPDIGTSPNLGQISTFTSGTTPAGTTTTPSGLAKINSWVDSEIDNTAKRFYGGDLLGNVWRFDIDSLVAPNKAAHRMAYLQAGSPLAPQPITVAPQLAEVKGGDGTRYPTVYVATGRLLGTADLSDGAKQSVYALKDTLTATELGDVRASSSVVVQVLSQASAFSAVTTTNNPVDWATKDGWRTDFLSAGERVNVEPQLLFNTLTVATNLPRRDDCSDGSSYIYRFDIGSGSSALGPGKTLGTWLGNTMVVGLSFVQLQKLGPNGESIGSGDTVTIVVDNNGNVITSPVPEPIATIGATKRTSWRELVD